jgi:hypothetical protein
MTKTNGVSMDTSGFDSWTSQLEAKARRGARNGVYGGVQAIHDASRQLAPLEHGTLRRESWTEFSETADTMSGEIYYSATEDGKSGRFNYALWLHEFGGKPAFVNPTTPGTQPKYLEQPVKQYADKVNAWIADEIRKELGL